MLDSHISRLPVMNKARRLVGILTERDPLRRSETGTERHRPRWLEVPVGPGRITGQHALDEVVRLMARHRVKQVQVLDGDPLVGNVRRADLLRALAGGLDKEAAPTAGDNDIRERVSAVLAKAAWAPGRSHHCRGGQSRDLNGVIFDEKERELRRTTAENLPVVRAVEDYLVWVEAVSGTIIDACPSPGVVSRRRHPRQSARTSRKA